MAKQSVAEESEVDAVAREIFTATAIQQVGRFNPDHIVGLAYQCAEVFVAFKAQRQNTAKPKGVTPDAD